MPREYRRMLDCEDEILKMREEGKTKREICEAFGFTMKQMSNFVTRHNSRQRKLAAGIAIKKKGRPPKDYVVSNIEGEYARLRDITSSEELFIAMALLPPNIDVGSRLHYELFEYTITE